MKKNEEVNFGDLIREDLELYIESVIFPREIEIEVEGAFENIIAYCGGVAVVMNRFGKHVLQIYINNSRSSNNTPAIEYVNYYATPETKSKKEFAEIFTRNILILTTKYKINPITLVDRLYDKTVTHNIILHAQNAESC